MPGRSEVPVEVLDFAPYWLAGGLAAAFARVQILVTYYDGDPGLWLEAIDNGSAPIDDGDVAFLESMRRRFAEDGALLDDMRRIVNEFAARMPSL